MSPRFDRRPDRGQGAGAGGGGGTRGGERGGARGGGGGGGKPGRPAYGGRGGSRPFAPRGEWRPEGGDRPERSDRGDRPERGDRGDRGGRSSMGEGRPAAGRKPFTRRPEGGPRRFESGGRPDGPRFGAGRPERRPGRPAGRFDDRGAAGGGGGAGRPERGPRPEGRRFSAPRPDGGSFRPGRPQGRPQFGARPAFAERRPARDRDRERVIAVEVPVGEVGESTRFNAGPADDLIWGRHAAQAALESDRPIHRIWCTAEMRFQPRFMQLLREAKAGGVLVEEVTWARLGQLTDGAVHQGIVLQAAAADTLDLGTLIDGCRNIGEPPLLMALDGITDPHNLGAIVRSAEALGAHGLVLPQRRSAGLTGSVAKVAAGALEHLPVARVVNLNRSLETLKEEGYRVIGLAGEGSVSLTEADLDGPLVIVTGSEGSGLSMLTRKHCDQLVRIPLRGATPSLNASVATAMVLYEVARRGWMKNITGSSPAPRIVRPQLATPEPLPASDQLEAVEDDDAFSAEEAAVASALVAEVVAEVAAELVAEAVAELAEEVAAEVPAAPADLSLDLSPSPAAGFAGDIQL